MILKILISITGIYFVFGQSAHAQSAYDPITSYALQSKLESYLSRFIQPERFVVAVRARLNQPDPVSNPYLPETWSRDLLMRMPMREISGYAEVIEIDLYLKLAQDTGETGQLRTLVIQELDLKPARGDRLNIQRLNLTAMEHPEVDQRLMDQLSIREQALSEANAKVRESEQLITELRIDRNNVERELALIRRELADRDLKLNELRNQVNTKADKSFWAAIWPEKAIELIRIIAFFFSLALVGIMLYFAIRAIALGVKAHGQYVASGLSALNQDFQPVDDLMKDKSHNADAASSEEESSRPSRQLVYERVQQMATELRVEYAERIELLVLEFLNEKLRSKKTIEDAVALMELYGPDLANHFFQKLSSELRPLVLEFLRYGRYSRPKVEILHDVGEKFKTLVIADQLENNRELNLDLRQTILRLSDHELLSNLLLQIGPELRARALLYLDERRTARLLELAYNQSVEALDMITEAMVMTSEVQSKSELDELIRQEADQKANSSKLNQLMPLVHRMSRVADLCNLRVREAVFDRAVNFNTNLKPIIEKEITSLKMLFRLSDDWFQEIMDTLGNSAISALLINIDDQQKGRVKAAVSRRRLPMIEDELEKMNHLPKTQRQIRVDAGLVAIIQTLENMKKRPEFKEDIETQSVSESSSAA